MHLDSLKFLCDLESNVFHEKRVLTIGKMRWYGGRRGKSILRKLTKKECVPQEYSEFVFYALGASEVASLDFSEYENAQLIHDLNIPVPAELQNSFDIIFDSGSMEHVFNPRIAISNYMRMCKIGGKIILALPANNQLGHGFYQFSPEFFFRILDATSGFHIDRLYLKTGMFLGTWYQLKDPKLLGHRLEIRTYGSTMIYVAATKIEEREIPLSFIQSDYELNNEPRITNLGRWYLNQRGIIQKLIKILYLKPRNKIRNFLDLKKMKIHL